MKPPETDFDRAAPSGWMARLVRFSSFSLEWVDRNDPILFMCRLIWRLNVPRRLKYIMAMMMGQIIGLSLGAGIIMAMKSKGILDKRRQEIPLKSLELRATQKSVGNEAPLPTTASPTHEKPE